MPAPLMLLVELSRLQEIISAQKTSLQTLFPLLGNFYFSKINFSYTEKFIYEKFHTLV